MNDALIDLMHTLQLLQLAATIMVGLQAPPRSLVAYQSRHPVHFQGNDFMNFGFENFGNTMTETWEPQHFCKVAPYNK